MGERSLTIMAMAIEMPCTETTEYLDNLLEYLSFSQRSWRNLSVADRVAQVRCLKLAIKKAIPDIVDILAASGKPEIEVLSNEITVVLRLLEYYCRRAPHILERKIQKGFVDKNFFPFKHFSVQYEPYGVFGMIPAWNNPFQFTFGDAIPALLAGNAVLVKPSELVSAELIKLMDGIVRRTDLYRVFKIIEGRPHTGAWMAEHCDGIHFTGSTSVGMQIQKICQRREIPFIGEMGGMDAMIVFPDGVTDRTINAAVWGRVHNSGQNCNAAKIIYFVGPRQKALAFGHLVAHAMQKLRPGIDYKPIVNEQHLARLREQLDDATAKNTIWPLLDPQHKPASAPRVFFVTENTESTKICYTETFGPILSIVPVATEDAVIELVNKNRFGLGCSIWTDDDERAERLVRELDVANVSVRDVLAHYAVPGLPFTGRRDSGTGVRHGIEGLLQFARPKSIFVTPRFFHRLPLIGTRETYWFPYGRFEWLFRLLVKRIL